MYVGMQMHEKYPFSTRFVPIVMGRSKLLKHPCHVGSFVRSTLPQARIKPLFSYPFLLQRHLCCLLQLVIVVINSRHLRLKTLPLSHIQDHLTRHCGRIGGTATR